MLVWDVCEVFIWETVFMWQRPILKVNDLIVNHVTPGSLLQRALSLSAILCLSAWRLPLAVIRTWMSLGSLGLCVCWVVSACTVCFEERILTQHVVCLHEKVHRGFSIFLPTQHVAFSAYPFSHGLQMQITHHQINSLLPTKATFTLASKVAQTRFLHLCVNRLYPLKLDPCGLFHTRINNLI